MLRAFLGVLIFLALGLSGLTYIDIFRFYYFISHGGKYIISLDALCHLLYSLLISLQLALYIAAVKFPIQGYKIFSDIPAFFISAGHHERSLSILVYFFISHFT